MAAALAVAAVGCGSAGAADAQYPFDSDSWRFELHTTTAPDDLGELRFAGTYDRMRRVGHIEVTDHEDASAYTKCDIEDRDYPEEMRVIRGAAYSRWLTWGESFWIKNGWFWDEEHGAPVFWPHPDVVRAMAPFPLGLVDPDEVLERLRSLGVEVVVVGSADVRGVRTTQYRARLDVLTLLQRIAVTQQPRRAVVDHWRKHPHPALVDVWLDDGELVRRIELRLNVEESGYLGDEMTYTLELHDFGVLVDAKPPKELATIEEYLQAGEELYPDDDRCNSPEYRLRPEEPDPEDQE
jgi:hypothetical protein